MRQSRRLRRPLAAAALTALLLTALAPRLARAQEQPARTMAVLPLAQGAGSEEYRGLGKALSGMLVSDLATVDALVLVERDRLRDLMSEMSLAETGFLDERTAQQLGNGLGAQLVLLGSYSVVVETFVLDARIVGVESGEILKAANSHGTVADFVSVEKELVENMLDGLEVKLSTSARRKLYLEAPTEQFEALKHYGEGLQAQDDGDLELAQVAFERAVEVDPEFDQAREALRGIRSLVDGARAEQRAADQAWKDAAHQEILAAYPDERERDDEFEDEMFATVGFALRLMVLENEELHCQRYEEMRHYLERNQWQIEEPPRPEEGGVFSYHTSKVAKEHDFDRLPRTIDAPDAAHDSPGGRVGMWRGTPEYVMHTEEHLWRDPGSGLVTSLRECFSPAEQLTELDELFARATQTGAADQIRDRKPSSGLTLGEALQLQWCRTQATNFGASPEMERRVQALLGAHPEDDPARERMMRKVEDIVKIADHWESHRMRTLGQSDETLATFMRALEAKDTGYFELENPYCSHFVEAGSNNALNWVQTYDKLVAERNRTDRHVESAGQYYGPMRDMGCIGGVEARFAYYDQVYAFIASSRDRAQEDAAEGDRCEASFRTVEQVMRPDYLEMVRNYPEQAPVMAWSSLLTYYGNLVFNRCVEEEW